MKKYFTLITFAVLAIVMGSCRGPEGRPGKDGFVNFKVIDLDVPQTAWGYTDPDNTKINNYFFADFDIPELTWDIYDNGLVKVYREYNTGTNQARQIELPYTHYVEELVDEATFTRYFYCEHVDYEFTQGQLSIYYTASDFDYDLNTTFLPEAMHFRVVIMW